VTTAEGSDERERRRVGTMVRDKYRIDAYIATGSMATVYAATHRNGSRVALKILHPELAKDKGIAERFKREGYFANAIGHTGIVRAIDDDIAEDGCAFIVMELLEGENLEERRVRGGGTMGVPEVLQIADAMLDVLSAAHDHEVLHRDLKPENVFITRKNEVKLLDFGVARFNDGRSSSDMTGVGMVLGTPAFMPPEQALGRREDVDARSDIWGVGATLFLVLTGEAVHKGGDAKTKLIATARTPARPIRDVTPEVPRAVAAVIDRALAFDKVERWADAKAMREALRWARMSLDGEVPSQLEPESDVIPPPVPTRRADADGEEDEDGPTLARKLKRQRSEPSFDETARLQMQVPFVAMKSSQAPLSDGVITSAPPVTRRADPPSMTPGEPTFSLRAEPVFSLRQNAQEPVPSTQRMPGQRAEAAPPHAPASASPPSVDAAAIFQAALANGGFVPDAPGSASHGPHTPRAGSVHPTRASGAPSFPEPAGGGQHAAHASQRPPKMGSTLVMPVTSAPPPAGHVSARPGAMHSSPPAGFQSAEQAGPLLSTIVEKRPNTALRVVLPLVIGLAAAAGTYAAVLHRRAAEPITPVSSATAAQPSTSAAAPPPSATATATAEPVPTAALSADPVPTTPIVAAAASSAPPKKKKPKPKPAASTVPTSTATGAATDTPPTPTAEPTPAPPPAPAPTANDALPKKDPE
jgi:serine/threonine protein kinase